MQELSRRPGNNFPLKYSEYGSTLFRISMAYLGNREDAEEVMQEAFYKLLCKQQEFCDEGHEKAWLIRVTVNLCKDMLRSVWHKRVVKMEEIEKYYDQSRDMDIMKEILRLPSKYKAVILLYYYEDYSVKQISEILKISDSATKMRLQRGRQLLKLELEGEEI